MIPLSNPYYKKLNEIKNDLEKIIFKGETFIDGERTGVEIKYIPPNGMIIEGLKADLPKRLELWPDKIKDLENGIELKHETGLHILYILDPRVVLANFKLLKVDEAPNESQFVIEYDLGILNEIGTIYLPHDFLDWLKEQGEIKRYTRIFVSERKIVKMIQKELPPSTQELLIKFYY
jgi:hypothetical protein